MTMAAMNFTSRRDASITILPAASDPRGADEVNHRIANSLQLLSAMVAMEARAILDPAALAALDMTRRRIAAIASVHRQLYQARRTASVDLGAYLEDLGRDLGEACMTTEIGRHVVVEASPVMVEAEHATAIGIIVSELVTNACKYAYAPGQPGNVLVTLRASPGGGYALAVEDRGRGLAAEIADGGTGFGAMLVDMMVARLGGQCAYHDARPGTRFVLGVSAH